METFDHKATAHGRAFLWGGIAAGVVLVALLLTHGFGFFAARSGESPDTPLLLHRDGKIFIPESSALRQRLSIAPAEAERASGKLVLPAVVESDPARTAAVLTPVAGRVRELKVALGDRVKAAEILAIIDSPDLGQAYADNTKAADAFELTRKNLERQEGQHKIGAASDHDLDQARSDHAQAAAEYTRTQARLRAIGAPADTGERSQALLLRAPVAGSVTTLTVANGNMVNDPTQPVMTIADLSTVWVTALVPEKDVGSVIKGEDADVTLAAYPGEKLRGKVLFVSDVIEADSHRNKLRIAFANPGYRLKPNMFATVTLLAPARMRVMVPTSALLMNNDRTSVFIATAPWTFERRTVETQLEESSRVVISSGVNAGEQVVVKGGILLND